MSILNGSSRQWSNDFLFPEYKILPNSQLLVERQKLAQFTYDLAKCLYLPDRCAYTAITCLHRFLTIQPSARIYALRVCQASVLLASKTEENVCRVKDVYRNTANVLKMKPDETPEVMNFHINAILDYENLIVATLGFGVFINHPQDLILETIRKIRDKNRSLPNKVFDNLTIMASFIEKQSILLTTFSLKYSFDLIAWFCIQLAIAIENATINLNDWNDRLYTNEQIQNLTNEFSIVYVKRSNIYKEKFSREENGIGRFLHAKASFYVNLLDKKLVTPALIGEGVVVAPPSPLSSPSPSLSSTTASSTQVPYQATGNSILSTNEISTESKSINPGDKRRYYPTNESLSSSEKRQKK